MDNALGIFGLNPAAQDKLALLAILVGAAPVVLAQNEARSLGVSIETRNTMVRYMLPGAALATAGAFMHSGSMAKQVGYSVAAFVAFLYLAGSPRTLEVQ